MLAMNPTHLKKCYVCNITYYKTSFLIIWKDTFQISHQNLWSFELNIGLLHVIY